MFLHRDGIWGFYGLLLAYHGELRLGDGFQYFDQIWTLEPLVIAEIISTFQEEIPNDFQRMLFSISRRFVNPKFRKLWKGPGHHKRTAGP